MSFFICFLRLQQARIGIEAKPYRCIFVTRSWPLCHFRYSVRDILSRPWPGPRYPVTSVVRLLDFRSLPWFDPRYSSVPWFDPRYSSLPWLDPGHFLLPWLDLRCFLTLVSRSWQFCHVRGSTRTILFFPWLILPWISRRIYPGRRRTGEGSLGDPHLSINRTPSGAAVFQEAWASYPEPVESCSIENVSRTCRILRVGCGRAAYPAHCNLRALTTLTVRTNQI